MPREPRVVAVGVPHHITQRGNARQDVFLSDGLRRIWLKLVTEHAARNGLSVLAWCVMTNHVHLVAIPEDEGSMGNTFRHAHGRFSQYWNTERNQTGHVWQNRFYSCPVEAAGVDRVIAYVEGNPVRAGMVASAEEFEWSSARAHMGMAEPEMLIRLEGWWDRWTPESWRAYLQAQALSTVELRAIRNATYTGRPLGSQAFVSDLEIKLGRKLSVRAGVEPEGIGIVCAKQMALWESGV